MPKYRILFLFGKVRLEVNQTAHHVLVELVVKFRVKARYLLLFINLGVIAVIVLVLVLNRLRYWLNPESFRIILMLPICPLLLILLGDNTLLHR